MDQQITTEERKYTCQRFKTLIQKAPSIKHQPISKRYYFDVALGSVCLTGADTGGAYCLLEVSLAPGIGVPRHIHTREDETYYVISGELEVIIGDEVFVLKGGRYSLFAISCREGKCPKRSLGTNMV